jgi:hypothetical protein
VTDEVRDHQLRKLLREGGEVAERLIEDNDDLRRRLHTIEGEISQLKTAIGSDDTSAKLLTRVDQLERERVGLGQRARQLEQTSRVPESRLREVEQELNDLASLYVASCQLGATLEPGRVLRHICELLEQLVGVQAFVVYLVGEDGELALPIASQGIALENIRPQSLSDGEIGNVCLTGVPHMRRPPAGGKDGEAIALVPLLADGQTVAVISVLELLPHKKSWAAVDSELFRLLSERASGALIAASQYDAKRGPRAALASLERQALHMDRERSKSRGGGG